MNPSDDNIAVTPEQALIAELNTLVTELVKYAQCGHCEDNGLIALKIKRALARYERLKQKQDPLDEAEQFEKALSCLISSDNIRVSAAKIISSNSLLSFITHCSLTYRAFAHKFHFGVVLISRNPSSLLILSNNAEGINDRVLYADCFNASCFSCF